MGVMDAPVLIHLPVYASGDGSTSDCRAVGPGRRRATAFQAPVTVASAPAGRSCRLRWDVAVGANGPCRQGRRTALSRPADRTVGADGPRYRRSVAGPRNLSWGFGAQVGVRSAGRTRGFGSKPGLGFGARTGGLGDPGRGPPEETTWGTPVGVGNTRGEGRRYVPGPSRNWTSPGGCPPRPRVVMWLVPDCQGPRTPGSETVWWSSAGVAAGRRTPAARRRTLAAVGRLGGRKT